MLTSALLAYSSLISPATSSLVLCMLLATAFSLFVFRPSFVNLRSTIDNTRAVSDLVGYRFLLVDDVSESQTAVHHYSGIAWRLRSRDAIKAGTWVEVTRAELGEFTIRPRYER
jgi:membrane protein implicated in regulation of membrane protease activity